MIGTSIVWRAANMSLRIRPAPLLANVLLAALLLAGGCLALTVGTRPVPIGTIIDWLLAAPIDPTDGVVLHELRAPRLLLALLSGAMLALAGGLTQHLTRNGLADPSLIGIKSGAAVCIVGLILFWPGAPMILRPAAGLAGGLMAGILLAMLARGATPLKFIMIGFGVSWCLSSLLVIMLTSADIRSLMRAMIWLAGSLEAADWSAVRIAALILVISSAPIFLMARHVELQDVGEAKAATLGVHQARSRILCLTAAVLLVAGTVSVVGGLGFVGLIAPHLARFLPNQGLRGRLAATMMIGAALVMTADLVGGALFAPIKLPVGIPLAAIGSPLLVLLLWLRRNRI